MTIKEMRTAKGYTQEKAAENLGIKQSYYSRIERGEANPTVEKLFAIAKLYDCTAEDAFRSFLASTNGKRCFLSLRDGLRKHLHVTLQAPAYAA